MKGLEERNKLLDFYLEQSKALDIKINELNLYQKMAYIEHYAPIVGKMLTVELNKSSKYKAVAIQDVQDALKPLEMAYGVKSIHNKMEVLESKIIEKETKYGTQITHFARVKQISKYVNVDNPSEYEVIEGMGDGLDSGDKTINKAETYAIKNILKKAYNLITSDSDPDQLTSEDTFVQKENAYLKKIKARLENYDIKGKALTELLNKVARNTGIDYDNLNKDNVTDFQNGIAEELNNLKAKKAGI